MKKFLQSLFRLPNASMRPPASEPAASSCANASSCTNNVETERAARDIGLDGWHNEKTGEVILGFPVTAQDRVLDVGCGGADHSRFCLSRGAAVTFTDIDAAVVDSVQQRFDQMASGKATGIVSDSYPLPVANDSMTRIIATEVLEHVDDVNVFMRELVRVGAPGALYFITVPDAVSENMQQGIAPDSYFQKPNHIRIIDREQFAAMVTNAGLVIESHKPYGAYWTLWWMFFWNAGVDLNDPSHPLLQSWANTWNELLKTQNPYRTIKALDQYLPKSQVILARKP